MTRKPAPKTVQRSAKKPERTGLGRGLSALLGDLAPEMVSAAHYAEPGPGNMGDESPERVSPQSDASGPKDRLKITWHSRQDGSDVASRIDQSR